MYTVFQMNFMKLIRYCNNSELANLVRIYQYKQTVLDCNYSNRVTDEEFEKRWKELTAMFTGVGVPVEDIDNYLNPWKYTDGALEGK